MEWTHGRSHFNKGNQTFFHLISFTFISFMEIASMKCILPREINTHAYARASHNDFSILAILDVNVYDLWIVRFVSIYHNSNLLIVIILQRFTILNVVGATSIIQLFFFLYIYIVFGHRASTGLQLHSPQNKFH